MKKIYALMIVLFLMNGAMAQWFPQNSGTVNNLNDVFFTDANTGFAVGDSGTILKTTNGGTDWITLSTGTSKALKSVFFTSPDIGYTVGDSGTILKTTNSGVNWEIQNSNTSVHLGSVHFPCPDTGYIAADGWCATTLLKTTNGGVNWTPITFDTVNLTFYSVYFTDANTGYLTGCLGGMQAYAILMKTTNGGGNWETQLFGGWGSYQSICFLDNNTGYVAGFTGDPGTGWGCLYKTTDGGDNWIQQSSCIGYLYKSVQFLNADTGFITTNGYYSEGAILKTTNGGLNLNGEITPTFNYSSPLNSVYFTDAESGYVVGGDGTILKTTDGGGFPVGIDKQHQTADILTIFPNPASTTITIETPTKGSLSIHNISGQQLLQRESTEPTATIDVSGLKSGIYVVKVFGERGVGTTKFVKY